MTDSMQDPHPGGDPTRKAPLPVKTSFTVKALDVLVFSLAALACVGAALALWNPGTKASTLFVEASGTTWAYPLSEDASIEVAGALGTSTITIENGHAHFSLSPCANKTCISSGSISSPNQWAACLPNKVLIRIDGDPPKGGVDALSY